MKNPGTLTGEVINSLLQLPLSPACLYTSVLCHRKETKKEARKKQTRNGVACFGVVSDLEGGGGVGGVIRRGGLLASDRRELAHLYRLNKGTVPRMEPARVPVLVKCVARMKRNCQGSFIGGESRAERRKRRGGKEGGGWFI